MGSTVLFDPKIFFLGGLCRHNHNYDDGKKTLRYVKTNNCVECSRGRCRKNYEKNKEIMKEQARNNYWANPKIHQKRNKDRRENNIEAYAARDKAYYEQNKEKIRDDHRKYNQKNKIKLYRNHRRYYKNNRERVLAQISKRGKEHRKSNSQIAIKGRLKSLFSHALKEHTETGKIKRTSKYGINYATIIIHLGPHPNTRGIRGDFHIDHIIPLSAFDLNNPEQIKLAFAPGNHQWLLAKANQKKGNRIKGQLNLMTRPQIEAVINAAN